jgi:hypothetical protein
VGLHKAHAGRKVDPQHMLTAQQPQQSEGHTRPIEAARNLSSRHENRSTNSGTHKKGGAQASQHCATKTYGIEQAHIVMKLRRHVRLPEKPTLRNYDPGVRHL